MQVINDPCVHLLDGGIDGFPDLALCDDAAKFANPITCARDNITCDDAGRWRRQPLLVSIANVLECSERARISALHERLKRLLEARCSSPAGGWIGDIAPEPFSKAFRQRVRTRRSQRNQLSVMLRLDLVESVLMAPLKRMTPFMGERIQLIQDAQPHNPRGRIVMPAEPPPSSSCLALHGATQAPLSNGNPNAAIEATDQRCQGLPRPVEPRRCNTRRTVRHAASCFQHWLRRFFDLLDERAERPISAADLATSNRSKHILCCRPPTLSKSIAHALIEQADAFEHTLDNCAGLLLLAANVALKCHGHGFFNDDIISLCLAIDALIFTDLRRIEPALRLGCRG